ncbi:TIGR03089 family protein [Arthrobacter pigmenti]
MKHAASVTSLLQALRQYQPSSPRLIWYGTGGERVELSGRVLDNWVAKTSNLLVDDLDATEDSSVLLAMPPHWRSLCWVLAAWQVGATVALQPVEFDSGEPGYDAAAPQAASAGKPGADVVVTTEPERFAAVTAPPQYLVAVALGALQMKWDGELPSDTVDYAGEVRSHADEYVGLSEPGDDGDALQYGTSTLSYGQLFSGFARQDLQPPTDGAAADAAVRAQTVLVSAGLPMAEVLQIALGSWAAGGAVVLVHPQLEVTESLVNSERVTRRFGFDPA